MSELLRASHLTKVYNPNTEVALVAINDVTLKIMEGDFICIMGPSGSGKSTLVYNLSTIDQPSEGAIEICEENLVIMPEYRISQFRRDFFGYIFQDLNLVESLTIYENVALPLLINKDKKNLKERVMNILRRMGIEICADKYPSECSGGQQQRAAIARALVKGPKLLIADEPTGNLDSQNSRDFCKMLEQLNKEDNISILMVTHDATVASYSNKFWGIKDGKIVESFERGDLSQNEYFLKIMNANLQSGENKK